MNKLPKARTDNIVTRDLNDEVLIYDQTTDRAFCLNETSAKVFNCCDGETAFAELKIKYRLTDGIIYLALDELKKNNLLADSYASPFAGLSRREVVKRVGLASMIALPVISSIVAPQAAHAASSGACSTALECTTAANCPAPCTACIGARGVCTADGISSCSNINGSCSSTGTCEFDFGAGTCSNSGRSCTTNANCTQTGTCIAAFPGSCA